MTSMKQQPSEFHRLQRLLLGTEPVPFEEYRRVVWDEFRRIIQEQSDDALKMVEQARLPLP